MTRLESIVVAGVIAVEKDIKVESESLEGEMVEMVKKVAKCLPEFRTNLLGVAKLGADQIVGDAPGI